MLMAAQADVFGPQQGCPCRCMHGWPRLRVACTPAEDVIDYNNSLRMGILECYSGMLNGLTKKKANQLLLPYAPVSFRATLSVGTASTDGMHFKTKLTC